MAKHTSARAEAIARPVLWLRLLIAAVAIGSALVVYMLVSWALQPARFRRACWRPAGPRCHGQSGASSAAVRRLFLTTLEARLKRRQALAALHEFRSIAHVIDMHQLTKDPSAMGGPRTSASPERSMTRFELVRYLSYCSELLSLGSKAAAVYAENIHDPAVIDAVGDIERLSTNLSQKIWQKITLVETDIDDARGAAAVSAGEVSQLPEPMRRQAPMTTTRLLADPVSLAAGADPLRKRDAERGRRDRAAAGLARAQRLYLPSHDVLRARHTRHREPLRAPRHARAQPLLRRAYRRRPGRRLAAWTVATVCRRGARRRALRARRRRHEGRDRLLHRGRAAPSRSHQKASSNGSLSLLITGDEEGARAQRHHQGARLAEAAGREARCLHRRRAFEPCRGRR